MDNLGSVVERFEMNNRRRRRMALVMLALGVVLAPLTVLMVVVAYANTTSSDDLVPSFVLGCVLGMLIMGVWLGVISFTRAHEFFELHEEGLAYVRGQKRRVVRFDEVETLKDLGQNNIVARIFARAAGGPTPVHVKPHRGQGLVIPSLLQDTESLIEKVRRAVEEGDRPRAASSSAKDEGNR